MNLKFILHFLWYCFGFSPPNYFSSGEQVWNLIRCFSQEKNIHIFIVKLPIIWSEQTKIIDKLLKVLTVHLLLPAVILDAAFNTASWQYAKRSSFLNKGNFHFTVCLGIQESVFTWDIYFGVLLISSGAVH